MNHRVVIDLNYDGVVNLNYDGVIGLPASILPGQCVVGACVAYRVAYPPGNLPRPPAVPGMTISAA